MRDFLQIAAQTNGKILNFSKTSRDLGVDQKSVVNYYSILEDTLVGFFLPSYQRSVRKKQREAPKVDLVVRCPGNYDLLVEIKSSTRVTEEDSLHLKMLSKDWEVPCDCEVWSQDSVAKKSNEVEFLPWEVGIRKLFDKCHSY